ncbi:MAG TPA: phosphatase PAP2 family protein [Polyangiales bacterium]|nr:phosphatase PAP2 family protein [Polyangiales bacterium]
MASIASRFSVFILAASLALTPFASVRADEPAAASSGPRLHWNQEWPYFRPIGYVLTGASVLGALGTTFLIDYPNDPHWRGGILFDNALRDLLRARNPGARDAIRVASDITMIASIVQTGLIDGALIPLLDHSPGVAAQLSLINAQAFALNILIATLLFKAVARARPLIADCHSDPSFDPLCDTGAYASFPSSHTSTAFTAAGLSCVHHAYLPLYGDKTRDLAACVESVALATATGLFRIIGDRHYATDVLFGAAIGFSIGYIYPWLLHYRYGADVPASSGQRSTSGTLTVLPLPTGLGLAGSF